ncbi:MAG: hypothetical protein IPL25_20160 [Saprospiraceae bacterium]|nr:hypothetical protein [Candidatus Vicinibacter affinis]
MNLTRLWMFFILLSWSCSKKNSVDFLKNPQAFQTYINGIQAGNVKRSDGIKIHFNQSPIDESQIGQDADPGLLTFSPGLKGKLSWTNAYTLSFLPAADQEISSKEYEANLQLAKLFKDVPDSLSVMNFKFVIEPIVVQVRWKYLRVDPEKDGALMLEANVVPSDELSEETLANLFEIKHSSAGALKYQFTKNQNGEILYKISSIPRTSQTESLSIKWSETPEEKNTLQEKKFEIPSSASFVVTGIETGSEIQKTVIAYFSDPLDQAQDLRGLVRLEPDSSSLELRKELDLIHVKFSDQFQTSKVKLIFDKNIKSKGGKLLDREFNFEFSFNEEKPKVRFTSPGNILPVSENLILPFEAINLKKVDVEIFKIFSNNVLYNMHLDFQEDVYNMIKLGRIIHQQTIVLENINPNSNRQTWLTYGLDLSKMITPEPGAIYEVRIGFQPDYSNFPCAAGKRKLVLNEYDDFSGTKEYTSIWSPWGNYEYEGSESTMTCYDYEDPCCQSYYSSHNFARKSILASDIAMTCKSSEDGGQTFVSVFNINDGLPSKSAEVTFYDQQLQVIQSGSTDGKGVFHPETKKMPAYAVAKLNKHYAYLKLQESGSLPLSEFDVSGAKSESGLKAFIYAERGIWRPGDTILLNAVVAQSGKSIPSQFPIKLEVKSPNGQTVFTQQLTQNLFGLYAFKIPISLSGITGNYKAVLQAGPGVFEHTLKVETVKPNRFKVLVDFPANWKPGAELPNVPLAAEYLHGAAANGKQVKVELHYEQKPPVFKKWKDFNFDDPEKLKVSGQLDIIDGNLNEAGKTILDLGTLNRSMFNGDIQAVFVSRIFDEGDMSTDYYEKNIKMFPEYVGIKCPETNFGKLYPVNESQEFELAVLTDAEQSVANRKLKVELFTVNWEWWYEIRAQNGQYTHSNFRKLVSQKMTQTDANGKAKVSFTMKDYDRYYIRVTNLVTNQTSGDYFYTGWPYEENDQNNDFVHVLNFKADKESYKIGEKATLYLPGAVSGQYQICIIKENKIIKHFQLAAQKDRTSFTFDIEDQMEPNVYADVSLIQPVKDVVNDLPVRMFGVIPIMVQNENRKLQPGIQMAESIKPDQEFEIEVNEASGKEMAYQLFVVDEGLLNLTRFKTPNPYDFFLQKEAMRMMTWDNYNSIIGVHGASFQKIFSIGGDQQVSAEDLAKMKRFSSVVLSTGVQHLKPKTKNKHRFTISNYIGEVRVMVVANNQNAYGSAEKQVKVKSELMSSINFPRVMATDDNIQVPVTVFVHEKNISKVDVKVTARDGIEIVGLSQKTVNFDRPGEQKVYFDIKAKGKIGPSGLDIVCSSGAYLNKSSVTVFIDNPNPVTRSVTEFWVEPGQSIQKSLAAYGTSGTRKTLLNVASFSGGLLTDFAEKLIQYPHGCVEQTVSAGFPQLYLADVMELSQEQKNLCAENVRKTIQKLKGFQRFDGGFSYWPGEAATYDYASSYVGHFLSEARSKGFNVPEEMLNNLNEYQRKACAAYNKSKFNNASNLEFNQAYRLYTLAVAGRADWAAMNRLMLQQEKTLMGKWLLAGAYALSGKKEIAAKLIEGSAMEVPAYQDDYFNYGSDMRDESFIAMVLNDMGNKTESAKLIQKIIKRIAAEKYFSTQEMSVLLLSMGKILNKNGAVSTEMKFTLDWNNQPKDINSKFAAYQESLGDQNQNNLTFKNNSSIPLSVQIIQFGKLSSSINVSESNGLKLLVSYLDKEGRKVDLANLPQGKDLIARVQISQNGKLGNLKNLALTAVFPSGMEINNLRIGGIESNRTDIKYQDFRDDRVMYYFDLSASKEMLINIPLTAATAGTFSSPEFFCEAMYEPSVFARYKPGKLIIKSTR